MNCDRRCGLDKMSMTNFVDKINAKDVRVESRLNTRGNTFFLVFRRGQLHNLSHSIIENNNQICALNMFNCDYYFLRFVG